MADDNNEIPDDEGDKTVVPGIGATHISGRSEFLKCATQLAQTSVRRLAILSYDFQPAIYGDGDFVSALRRLALAHRMAEIRVLIHTPELAMRRGHRAVELGRQVSSHFHFRELAEQHRDVVEELVIADEIGYLHRESPESLDAMFADHDPAEARRHLRDFDRMWEMAIPSTEMRSLGI